MIINERNNLNESCRVVMSWVNRYIRNKDKKGLTQYLASMPDDTICPDPNDSDAVYHKASNGVKSGWSYRVRGDRKNVTLYHDDEVADFLIRGV